MNTPVITINPSKKVISVLILALVLFAIFVRFYDLTLDSFSFKDYGISWGDEGAYLYNAITKAYYGFWSHEKNIWNPMYLSPVLTLMGSISFSLFGVNTFAARILPSIFGFLAVFLASFLIYRKDKKTGIIFFTLAVINTFLVAYSRVGTLEQLLLSFMILIIGLIVTDSMPSWFGAGSLVPFLFFSKPVSIFFILAIPISLFLYLVYTHHTAAVKKLASFFFGCTLSSLVWLIWFIPSFSRWFALNASFGHRAQIIWTKYLGALYGLLQFLFKNQILAVLVVLWVLFIIYMVLTKKKISYLDLFLCVSFLLFYIQIIFLDMYLRRFVLLIPLFILASTRILGLLSNQTFAGKHSVIKLSETGILLSILLLYVFFTSIELGAYFYGGWVDSDSAHSFVRGSHELTRCIPEGATVYGELAYILSQEKKIIPYKNYVEGDAYEREMLPLFHQNKIDYVIYSFDIFNEYDVWRNTFQIPNQEQFEFIRKNYRLSQEIVLKDSYTHAYFQKYYLYKNVNNQHLWSAAALGCVL